MIQNLTRDTIIARQVVIADSFPSRLKGLLGRKEIGADEVLVITACQQIHMFFMQFAIDVIFVDGKDQVVGLVRDIQPSGVSPVFWKANRALELLPGTIDRSKTRLGDQLRISESPR